MDHWATVKVLAGLCFFWSFLGESTCSPFPASGVCLYSWYYSPLLHPQSQPGQWSLPPITSLTLSPWFPFPHLKPSAIALGSGGMCVLVTQSCPTLATPWTMPTRLLCPWDSLGKNTGVGWHTLLQGIFLTQGTNMGIPHCRQILYHLSHQGNPNHKYILLYVRR